MVSINLLISDEVRDLLDCKVRDLLDCKARDLLDCKARGLLDCKARDLLDCRPAANPTYNLELTREPAMLKRTTQLVAKFV
jgi:hypothetical protein